MLQAVRSVFLIAAALLIGCATPPPQEKPHQQEPTAEKWYTDTLQQLVVINRQARESFEKGKADDASALIQKGEPLSKRLISVPRPTLAATEAASDLDHLYGRMLLSNRNYGWARLFFQKNLVRWKYWKPQTEESVRRLKEAQDAIAECDRRIAK